ncbi:MAG TPA: glutathione S-transferase family protein [Xanthobacteraceae bacterium]|nr:glutathione S-transferase family protein [Xanthobacteraceae bacterium]
MALTLVIGDKNYSSWSLRPWIAMRATGIVFEEKLIPLYGDGYKERLLELSPAGKVPILFDGSMQIWESLAIIEHLAERFPDAGLWPADPQARAHARAVSAEMHAGFEALRRECPMDMCRTEKAQNLSPQAQADVQRIDALWTDSRQRFGAGGPFLFGAFSAADAMYAPVVSRCATYGLTVGPVARAYMHTIMSLPAYVEWKAAGIADLQVRS